MVLIMWEDVKNFFTHTHSITTMKIIFSVVALFLLFASGSIVKFYALKIKKNHSLSEERYYTIRHKINLLVNFLIFIAILIIWSVNLKDLWIALSSVLAMIAVAFVAMWSIITNVLAGILLFFTTPFKIGDYIEVSPDNIKGKVLSINTFFTLLEEDRDDNIIVHINVPHSLFFQKYVKKYKKSENDNNDKKTS